MNIRISLAVLIASWTMAGCAPGFGESASSAVATIRASGGRPTGQVTDLFTAGSVSFVEAIGQKANASGLLALIEAVLSYGGPDPAIEGLFTGADPDETVFFVRDGHSNRIDLALSGVTFRSLREPSYPLPW